MANLEKELMLRFQDAIRKSIELGYRPTYFIRMLTENESAVDTAKDLLSTRKPQTGLFDLAEIHRLDLSVESIILDPKFTILFEPEELEEATRRLKEIKGE